VNLFAGSIEDTLTLTGKEFYGYYFLSFYMKNIIEAPFGMLSLKITKT